MSLEKNLCHLPPYQSLVDSIAVLDLSISLSELHGVLCGYLCAGVEEQGAAYLRSLTLPNREEFARAAVVALFNIFSISQQQIDQLDFSFEMLLPDDHEPLPDRVLAFSQWCDGFTQGMFQAGMELDSFEEEDSQEALQHLLEFAELDYSTADVSEEDEKALVEVSEYARMAVLRLHGDLQTGRQTDSDSLSH